jgi:MscS family membrane protein
LLFALYIFGISSQTLLAFGGLSGIAVGWMAKDIIANFFAGLMIYLNQPFLVGDWVHLPTSNVEGIVEDISWYLTCIRTIETRPVYIPNAIVFGSIIENAGRISNRHIHKVIRIRLQDVSIAKSIVDSLRGMLESHAGIDQKRTNTIYVVNFGEYSLREVLENHAGSDQKRTNTIYVVNFSGYSIDIDVSVYTKTTNYIEFLKVQQEILFKIIDTIKEHGGEIIA